MSAFLSIAGRWQQCSVALQDLPDGEKARCLMVFYAGFAAGMEATVEVSDYSETDAMKLLTGLGVELQTFYAMADKMMTGVNPS